jgi:hypothetical protein
LLEPCDPLPEPDGLPLDNNELPDPDEAPLEPDPLPDPEEPLLEPGEPLPEPDDLPLDPKPPLPDVPLLASEPPPLPKLEDEDPLEDPFDPELCELPEPDGLLLAPLDKPDDADIYIPFDERWPEQHNFEHPASTLGNRQSFGNPFLCDGCKKL